MPRRSRRLSRWSGPARVPNWVTFAGARRIWRDAGGGGDLVRGTFRSLHAFNYRVWAGGAIVSNVGTWMQRIAQDWLVLTRLTHGNATAVGMVMALQFGPQ